MSEPMTAAAHNAARTGRTEEFPQGHATTPLRRLIRKCRCGRVLTRPVGGRTTLCVSCGCSWDGAVLRDDQGEAIPE